MRGRFLNAIVGVGLMAVPAWAAEKAPLPDNPPLPAPVPEAVKNPPPMPPEVDACRASGLIALKQRSPAIKAIDIDPASTTISDTDLMVEQTHVRTIVLGNATIDTRKTERPNQFVCLIGDSGKVLLTYFTSKE